MFFRSRLWLFAISFGAGLGLVPSSAPALERLVFDLPVLESQIDFELGAAQSAGDLIDANPDFVELDRATDGAFVRLLNQVFNAPLPAQIEKVVEKSVGQPLLEQALIAVSKLVQVEGLPQDTSGRMLLEALSRASKSGQPTVLGLLRQIPGQAASINLSKLASYVSRLQRNQLAANLLVEKEASVQIKTGLRMPLTGLWLSQQVDFQASHRSKPIRVVVIQPKSRSNGRLVVISHGLWESPRDLQGWAEYLSANGYTVLLPEHQGSDADQQKAMLAGDQPPPGPQELRLRAMDVTAMLSAVESGGLLSRLSLNTDEVAVVGHSWGATTAIQLAGARSTDVKLSARCHNQDDPERNISWILQCSWLSKMNESSVEDSRVKAVVAVSPPLRLLFDPSRTSVLTAKVLLVSGTRDWVVPPVPEALMPMRDSGALEFGHRLVLAQDGGHFNLMAPANQLQPATLAPLILAWINEQLANPGVVTFSGGGWGDAVHPLVDVTDAALNLYR